MLLIDALEAMDARSLERLCRRRSIQLDPSQRHSRALQAARGLAHRIRNVSWSMLPPSARQAATLLAAHAPGAPRHELGGGVLPLLEEDIVMAVPGRDEVAMPAAFRLQMPSALMDDPLTLRGLLSRVEDADAATLGKQLLGRRPVGPMALVLGQLLEHLESAPGRRRSLAELSPKQSRLLGAIEARGGQLETEEILELERSALQMGARRGPFPSRSAGHQLFIRGLLLSRQPGLWTIPTEIAKEVGAGRREVELGERRRLLADIADNDDHEPRRAHFGLDPSPRTAALLCSLQERGVLPEGSGATRLSAMKAAAVEVGLETGHARLLAALSRSGGAKLYGATLAGLGRALFERWRDGSLWDEARLDPDGRRGKTEVTGLPTPTHTLREGLLELLRAMPEGRFAPLPQLFDTTLNGLQCRGATRLLDKARSGRANFFRADTREILQEMATQSLPALGAVDWGKSEGVPTVRLSARARHWLEDEPSPTRPSTSRWEGSRLAIGSVSTLSAVLRAAVTGSVIASEEKLWLRVSGDAIGRALCAQLTAKELQARLEGLGPPLSEAAARAIKAASTTHVQLPALEVSIYVPVSDARLLKELLDDSAICALLSPRCPEDGLLFARSIPREKILDALRRHSVVLTGI